LITVGTEAPDFELLDTEGGKTRLSDFRGKKNVLLAFYPFAFSPTCHGEFCTLRDENADMVSTDDLEIIGISVDHVFALKAWKEQEKFPNRFVADFWPHGAVSEAYGVLNERGFAKRQTFLIDRQGIVRYVEDNPTGAARDQAAWRKAAAELA
jgi:mycoredoxin-dependent peroxiredoxin